MKLKNINGKLALGIFICSIASLFYCYEYLLRIVPGVMEAQLRVSFGNISATAFGTLSAYYYFAYTPMQLPVGLLMDKYGPRRLLIFACLMCSIGSWLFTFTGSILIASLGRFMVGFGSAFAFVGVLSLAVVWLPKKFFSMVAGFVTTLGMLGAIGGQVGMTYLAQSIGWQKVLLLGPIIGLVLCVLMFIFIKDKNLVVKQQQSNDVSLKKFLKNLYEILSNGQIWLVGLIGSLLYLSLSVFAEIWGKSYLMVAHSLSSLEASSSISMVFLGWAVGGPMLGLIADFTDRRSTVLILGSILAAISVSLLLYVSELNLFSINILLFCYGLFCSVEVIVISIAKDSSTSKLSGTVFACVNMIIMLGGVIFQPLVGELLDYFWNGSIHEQIRIYSEADYQLVLSFLPLSLICVAIAVFFVRENSSK